MRFNDDITEEDTQNVANVARVLRTGWLLTGYQPSTPTLWVLMNLDVGKETNTPDRVIHGIDATSSPGNDRIRLIDIQQDLKNYSQTHLSDSFRLLAYSHPLWYSPRSSVPSYYVKGTRQKAKDQEERSP
ncbi:hypothetical protein Moror_17799 [Moniliophthora roreri MCA 2997]|uniref:Uncharacterized protein n=1 Tax=Moniliophthora roreri (strain MCA 2997) TaxID=1381753 RepID=V2XDU6_MONRO|nr:hypothetical protein Moror_17799 [Moniliophthora roreri MCA 2997]